MQNHEMIRQKYKLNDKLLVTPLHLTFDEQIAKHSISVYFQTVSICEVEDILSVFKKYHLTNMDNKEVTIVVKSSCLKESVQLSRGYDISAG